MLTNLPLRVLVLGIDAATFWLIEPWVEAGHLPTFAKLIREGVSAQLASTIPYVSGPAWATFATGKQPGKHGIFDFAVRKPNSYEVRLINAQDIASQTLWSILSQHQKRLAVVNTPVTYPAQPINGYMVTGMLTPSIRSQFTYPADLQGELLARFPDYIIDVAEASPDRARTKEAVARKTHHATQQRLALTEWLMEKMPDWDFFMTVWTETDRIQTYLWDDMDPAHPRHESRFAQRFGAEILGHYQHLDRILDKMLKTVVDERTILLVISDHGFGGVHRFFYPNCWLAGEGYLRLKQRPSSVSRLQAAKKALNYIGLAHYAKKLVKTFAPSWGTTTQLRHTVFSRDVDWRQTRAFWAADNGISINLKGREPLGVVAPGSEYELICRELKARLLDIRDPVTGEKIIAEVYHRSEIYEGPWSELSPDLRIVWQEYPEQKKTYFSAGELWGPDVFGDAGQTGDHAFQGIMLAYGAPLKQGYRLRKAGIVDMAPTILYAMGLPIPEDMDGRVLQEIFADDWKRRLSLQFSEASPARGKGFNEQEPDTDDEILRKRLRDLGYID
jgi:predicted AlkP superfamily phosphohydrolase/phosphomutase